MAEQAGTLEQLAIELAQSLAPLAGLLSQDEVLETLGRFGVAFPEGLLAHGGFDASRQATSDAATALGPAVEALVNAIESGDPVSIVSEGLKVLEQAGEVINSFAALQGQIMAAAAGLPGVTAAQVNDLATDFPRKLLDLLIADQLDIIPAVGATLTLAGVIERISHAGDPANPTMPAYESVKVHYNRIFPLLFSTADYFKGLYGWGDPAFNPMALFQALEGFIARLGLPALLRQPLGAEPLTLEAFALDFTPTTAGSPPGLNLQVMLPIGGGIDQTIPLPHPDWKAHLKGTASLMAGTTGTIRPPLSIIITPPGGQIQGEAELTLQGKPATPFVLLGQAGSSRLELASVEAGTGFAFAWDPAAGQLTAEPQLSGDLAGGKLIIDTSKSDGFLARLLSGLKVEAGFELKVSWNSDTGIRFEGSSTLEIALPVHLTIGPIDFKQIYLIASLTDGEKIGMELSAALNAKLFALDAVVDRLGMLAELSFPEGGGNVGPGQLDLHFKPPTGVGLSIDGGGFKGGGFLRFDYQNEQYDGVLELDFQSIVTLKAVGLITTRLPGGEPGFSLLIIISAEFTPVQLGFGFTLVGVGGLLGLHRTVKIEVIREGIKTNALASVLFPKNIVANAPKIISDLKQIFPPQVNRFAFGPMAKLGWGTPTLLSLELGLIIELPSPVRIAILGVFRAILPDEKLALIRIQVNFLGSWEEDKGLISFDAGLFDSRLLTLPLAGDMAFRLIYGDNPNFLVSVGGFHPAYIPPPLGLPPMQRITINLLAGDNPRMALTAYFAVTSNTVQVGAKIELEASAWKFNVYGFLAFDALFQFSPFYFIVGIAGGVAVRIGSAVLFSISLELTLSGPTPWNAKGTASFKIFWFITVKVGFDVTWGEERDTTLPDVEVLPQLLEALQQKNNWEARLPSRSNLLVSLREIKDAEAEHVIAHPAGVLTVSQKVVPLDTIIDLFGSQKPSDGHCFTIDKVRSNGLEFKKVPVEEYFAPSQFEAMDDAQKLSRQSFEKLPSGVKVTSETNEIRASKVVLRLIAYETWIIDTRFPVLRLAKYLGERLATFMALLKGNAVAKSRFSSVKNADPVLGPGRIKTRQEGYSVVGTADLLPFNGKAAFGSEAGARSYLRELIRNDPSLKGKIQVVPNYEMQQAA
jgi:hypothetical protein